MAISDDEIKQKINNLELIVKSYNTRFEAVNISLADVKELLSNLNSNVLKKEISNLKLNINDINNVIKNLKDDNEDFKNKIDRIRELEFSIKSINSSIDRMEKSINLINKNCSEKQSKLRSIEVYEGSINDKVVNISDFVKSFEGIDITDLKNFVKQFNALRTSLPLLVILLTILNFIITFYKSL